MTEYAKVELAESVIEELGKIVDAIPPEKREAHFFEVPLPAMAVIIDEVRQYERARLAAGAEVEFLREIVDAVLGFRDALTGTAAGVELAALLERYNDGEYVESTKGSRDKGARTNGDPSAGDGEEQA